METIKAILIVIIILGLLYYIIVGIENKLMQENLVLRDIIDIKDRRIETLYKCLLEVKNHINLSMEAANKNDIEEHNKILNEITDFLTQIKEIKEDEDAEIRKEQNLYKFYK